MTDDDIAGAPEFTDEALVQRDDDDFEHENRPFDIHDRSYGSVVEQVHRVIESDRDDLWVLAEEVVKFVREQALAERDKSMESNFVKHAKREMELLGEDDEGFVKMIVNTVAAFAAYGHSGGSHGVAVHLVGELLQFNNLTPLTNDPKEWQYHNKDMWPPDGIWQNLRNSKAFSADGGRTYWVLNEALPTGTAEIHTSVEATKE